MEPVAAIKDLSAPNHLKNVQQMVRFGMYRDISNLKEWSNNVAEHLQQLQEMLVMDRNVLGQEEYLQYIALRAEYLDTMGRDENAALVLRQVIPEGCSSLHDWMNANPLEISSNRAHWGYAEEERFARRMRQIGWLHMEFAWVCYYRKGLMERALEYLEEVHSFLRAKLIEPEEGRARPSHGTLFRYFYYRGHCELSLRRFRESLQSFTEAQRHAGDRYTLKTQSIQTIWEQLPDLKRTEKELMRMLSPERRFSVISTARILGGGLAWNSIQRGGLRHAQEVCLSAETLLLGTGQEPMRAYIRSNRLVAQRRAEVAYSTGFSEAMKELRRSFEEYREVDDPLGQMRCGLEVVRGHLDALQYWKLTETLGDEAWTHSEKVVLAEVGQLLGQLGEISARTMDKYGQFRIRLLKIRYSLLSSSNVSQEMAAMLGDELLKLAEAFQVGPSEAEHLILMADVERFGGNTKKAIQTLRETVSRTRDRNADQNWDRDPVIHSECHLRLADLHLKSLDYASANAEMGHWKVLSQMVEHAHLHRYADQLERRLNESLRPEIFRLEDDLNWAECQVRLRNWIARAAQHRAGPGASGAKVAGILGVSPSQWSRWDEEKPKRGRGRRRKSATLVTDQKD